MRLQSFGILSEVWEVMAVGQFSALSLSVKTDLVDILAGGDQSCLLSLSLSLSLTHSVSLSLSLT